jgi:hypothetical protein
MKKKRRIKVINMESWWTNSEEDKQILKEKLKKKNPEFRIIRISVLVVLVLLLQHPDLFVCISQAGLELASGSAGALLFSQCNMVWRSFVQAGSSGFWSFVFIYLFFFLPSVAPAGKYSVWSAEGLLSTLGVSSQRATVGSLWCAVAGVWR